MRLRSGAVLLAIVAAPLAGQTRCPVDTTAHMVEVPTTLAVEGSIGDDTAPIPQLTRALGYVVRRRFTPPSTIAAMVPIGRIMGGIARPEGTLRAVVDLTLTPEGRITHARWMQPARDSATGVALLDALRAAGREGDLADLVPILAGRPLRVRLVDAYGAADPVLTIRQRVLRVDHPPEYRGGAEPERTGLQGDVVLLFTVTEAGRVDSASVRVLRSTEPRLDPLAIAAIRHAKFRPARIGDCPVPQEIGQAFRFNASSPTRP